MSIENPMENPTENSFKAGGAHYRARPFWSWNTEVTPEKVRLQTKMFADMGMGGFVIHSRNGLRTQYMGKHFMDMVKLSIECAHELGLKVWLYDEDRWPSGNGGGRVTADRRYRQRSLVVTTEPPQGLVSREESLLCRDYFVAAYKLDFDADGCLCSYSVSDDGKGDVYAYVHIENDNPRYNWQSNVDVLNKDAIAEFIDITYEAYYKEIGEHFGKTVEAIFTDEPQGTRAIYANSSDLSLFRTAQVMWTDDFADTYAAEYGEDIIEHIPAILWESADSARVRYRYHEHCAARFREAYTKQLGEWCEAHGIAFTGHFIFEETLASQTVCTKDVMRCYADEHIPGIDILQGKYELSTAVQCRSVARQYGRRRVMSELYGVNNWDTSFRDYIRQGNWQTALGINIRVPHLSWMSMLGEGKRDYPATFSYQSPWYLDAGILEDHFSRLHTVLENGEPRVRVGVIHPIESYWTVKGPADKTARKCLEKDREFSALFDWLSFDGIDFDLINESLLPSQLNVGDGGAYVGKMKYDAVLVPNCITLRSTTVEALRLMKDSGVKVVFAGAVPALADGVESKAAACLAESCLHVEYTYGGISAALDEYRAFELLGDNADKYIFCDVDYDGSRWLFLSPARAVVDSEDSAVRVHMLKLRGTVTPRIYDSMTGEIRTPEYEYSMGNTLVLLPLGAYDTVLLRLDEGAKECKREQKPSMQTVVVRSDDTVAYRRAEDNVILLDMAEYSLDGKVYMPREEILRIDTLCREKLGLCSLTGKLSPQPWSVTDECAHKLYLRFRFYSEKTADCRLAFERAERIWLNGGEVGLVSDGWYVDRDIRTVSLPRLRVGENVLELETEIGKTYGAEPVYVIGDFNVRLEGTWATLTESAERIAFGSAVNGGMPFYGGSLSYFQDIDLCCDGELRVSANYYRCAFVKVLLDGKHVGNIILPPYEVRIPDVSAGKHTLELVAVGNRHNTFGSLHWGIEDPYYGPMHWHKYGDAYSREYRLRDFGIMKCPEITLSLYK
ncbi:MAG: hypothetical protein IJY08_06470 [Clostridia bacterium]|nr:hypothetical protein [Clostridia bacterium]